MRIFIGVVPPITLQKELEKFLKKLAKKHWPVNWEPVDKLHFTLAFLGNVSDDRIEMLCETTKKVCNGYNPFGIKIKGLGCFPSHDWPRIIWLGLKGDLLHLAKLQKSLAARCKKSGFSIDQKPFLPHITLGRIKQARTKERREMGRQLKVLQRLEFKSDWLVDEIIVFESRTATSGSVYHQLGSCRLTV